MRSRYWYSSCREVLEDLVSGGGALPCVVSFLGSRLGVITGSSTAGDMFAVVCVYDYCSQNEK